MKYGLKGSSGSIIFIAALLFLTTQVVSAADKKPGEWTERSLNAYHAGKFDEAIKYAVLAIQSDPNDAEAYNARGLARYGQDQKDLSKMAVIDFDIAIKLRPDFAMAYMNRGNAKSSLGEYDSALEDENYAIKLDPNSALAYLDRGAIYYRMKSYDKAIADFNRSLELKPEDPEVLLRRGNSYFRTGDHDRALQDLDRAVQLNPKNADLYKSRARVYAKKGEFDKALQEADRALAIKPLAGAYNARGDAYRGKGELERAIKDYDECIKLNPEQVNLDAYYGRGMAYKAKGDTKQASEDLKKAIELEPSNAAYKKELAEVGNTVKTPDAAQASGKEQKTSEVLFSEDETLRGANPPATLSSGSDNSAMEQSEHFRVFYDKTKWPTVGPNNGKKEPQEPKKFAQEVGTYLDHAWAEYHRNGYPRPHEEECKAWDSIRTVPSSIPYPPRIDATIDPKCVESETGTLSGKITLKFDYESMDQVRHDAAHETFHTFQQSLFYTLSSLAQRGYVARHWWMEATADYAADRIALGGSGTMAKPNLEYFKAPLNTADQIHDYATSRFIDYLVEQKGVVFKDLWDASIANSSDDMVAFLETYLMKTTATTLHDHYKGFAEYVLFDASSPLELNKGSGLSGVTMTSGPYKGKLQGGLVEADTPPVLAADKKEISYVFNLTGGYTAKLWGFKALNKDPRSPRTLKIEAVDNVPKAPDVDANVYVLKKDERLKGGAAVNPDIFKGTISANRKKISLTLAADEVAYILAFNTGSGDKKLTVKVGEEGLTISPLTASVNTGNNVNFSTPGVTDEVLWSVPGEGGGTISSQGVYTAPNKAGTYQVEVALKSNPAMTAGALVTVTEPAGSEELKTVKMHIDGFDAEVTGYFLGGKLIKRHGLTKRFDGEGKKFEEDDYQDGKKIRARGYNSDNGRLMSESEFCGDADKEFECHRKDFALDGTIEFEKRRLSKDADWQSKTSTGEWF